MRPFVDGERMLRVDAQLQNSSLNYHIANLLIIDVHESVDHLGQEYDLTSLRQKYWIVKGGANV